MQQWHDLGVACLTRDMLCLMAARLTGSFVAVARAGTIGIEVIAALLQELEEHQEVGWLDFIIQEVIQVRPR